MRCVGNRIVKETNLFVLKNGIYNSVGGIVRLAVALALVPFLIRIIGTTEYGIWSLTFAIVGVSAVTEIGLSSAVTVFAARDLAENNHRAFSETLTISITASLFLGAAVAVSLMFGADAIVNLFPKIPTTDCKLVAKALRVGSVLVLARLPQQALIGLQQAFQRFGVLNAVLTLQSVMLGIAMVIVAAYGGGTFGFMIVQTVVAIAALFAHGVAVFRLLRQEHMCLHWNTSKTGQMFRFGLLNTISNVGGVLFTQCDRLIVGAFLDIRTLGVYAAITTITTQINAVSALPVQPLLGRVTHLWTHNKRPPGARDEIRHALQFNAALSFGIAASIVVLAPIIARGLFHGAVDAMTVQALRYASLIYAIYSLNALGYFILPAIGELTPHTVIQLLGGALSLLLIGLGGTHWGLLGAVVGNIGFVTTLLLTWLALKRLEINSRSVARWLRFPILWIIATVAAAILLPQKDAITYSLLVISSVALCWWTLQQFPMVPLAKWANLKINPARS